MQPNARVLGGKTVVGVIHARSASSDFSKPGGGGGAAAPGVCLPALFVSKFMIPNGRRGSFVSLPT